MPATILVVDDEELTRKLLHHLLTRAGYDVIEAADGVEALEQLAAHKPDLVIMDVLMPRQDGFTTLRHIRANPETAHLPVIFLSSRADVAAEHTGLESGAQRYLTKPLGLTDVVTQVQELLASQT